MTGNRYDAYFANNSVASMVEHIEREASLTTLTLLTHPEREE